MKINVAQPLPPPAGGGDGDGGLPSPPIPQPCAIDPALSDITNNITNSCLSGLLNQLISNNSLQTNVTSILRNTFAVNDDLNVSFTDGVLTKTSLGTGSANIGADKNAYGYNVYITFNTPIISNASKEYLMETAIHEIFHAYLDVNPSLKGTMSQHLYMVQNYVNTEVQTIQQVFPSLSTHDAQCLVLAGYGDLQSADPAAFNTAIEAYNLSGTDIATTNDSFKSGTTGTKC